MGLHLLRRICVRFPLTRWAYLFTLSIMKRVRVNDPAKDALAASAREALHAEYAWPRARLYWPDVQTPHRSGMFLFAGVHFPISQQCPSTLCSFLLRDDGVSCTDLLL